MSISGTALDMKFALTMSSDQAGDNDFAKIQGFHSDDPNHIYAFGSVADSVSGNL